MASSDQRDGNGAMAHGPVDGNSDAHAQKMKGHAAQQHQNAKHSMPMANCPPDNNQK